MSLAVSETPSERIDARPNGSDDQMVRSVRRAQKRWAAASVPARIKVIRSFRWLLAEHAQLLASGIADRSARSIPEVMLSEVLPLADACRFAEGVAAKVLRPRRQSRRLRPWWLPGTQLTIHREAVGLIMIVGPSNYPLMLPGISAIEALVAGNAVICKPGQGGRACAEGMRDLLIEAGLDRELMIVTDPSPQAAQPWLDAPVDKVFLTGSLQTGRLISRTLAEHVTPSVMELSGCDAVIVADAESIELAARAIAFGLRFNGSATCIAPRRAIVSDGLADRFIEALTQRLVDVPAVAIPVDTRQRVCEMIEAAGVDGAVVCFGNAEAGAAEWGPIVVDRVQPGAALAQADVFAPLLSVMRVDSQVRAVNVANQCPYGLGAAIFCADRRSAEAMARQLDVGCVVINDMIGPTADPRLPFGGRRRSGHGVTRGRDGLLACTQVKAVVNRRGRSRPHYQPLSADQLDLARAMIHTGHARRFAHRLRGLWALVRGGASLSRSQNDDSS